MKQLQLDQQSEPAVVSIGNFDGLHMGHQTIINQVKQYAKQHNLVSTIIVFEPQPREFFQGENAPARLTNLAEKLYHLERLGVEQVLVINFDETIKNLSPNDFIQHYLIDKANAQHVIVGDDFKFGANRQGDFGLLQQQAAFTAEKTETVFVDDLRVSSSRVRNSLQYDNFVEAAALLARPYTMRGEVIKGDQNGRKLGAPTANIKPQRLVLPLSGVFAVRVHGLDRVYNGVANLGTRPTLDGMRTLLETHIFDFDQAIYGQIIEIEFCHKVRNEKKFDNIQQLQQQIVSDIHFCHQYFLA